MTHDDAPAAAPRARQRAAWLPRTLVAFDTETTGVDVRNDRIVTAAIVSVGPGGEQLRREWLVDPGIEIPEEATKVHGVTTEFARANGMPAGKAILGILEHLGQYWRDGVPVAVMNAPFDLSPLVHEASRHGFDPPPIGHVIDPLCIDRAIDPYRRGKRNLETLAQVYEVKQDDAHTCLGDALTTARVVWRMAQRPHESIAGMSLADLQAWQRDRWREWAVEFERYLTRKGKPETIDPSWPIRGAA